MANKRTYILILMAISLVALSVHAEVYRWVDKNGDVHFGDQPANKKSAEKIEIRTDEITNAPSQGNRLRKQQHLLSVMDEEREIKKKKQLQEKKAREKIIVSCKRAKKTLNDYLQSGILYDVDKKGNKIYLSDQERDDEIKKAREAVEYWCK